MFDGLVSGRLFEKPIIKPAKSSGKDQIKVVLTAIQANGESVFVTGYSQNVDLMRRLSQLEKGDAVCLSGEVTTGAYIRRDGEAVTTNMIWIHGVLTPYHAGRKRKDAEIEGVEYG